MWHDPMDELIADLEQVAPPERSQFGGNSEDFIEVQKLSAYILRRVDEAYADNPVDPNDPKVQRAAENMHRAMNRYVGRPEDWTPDA